MIKNNLDEIIDVEIELTTNCNANCPLCYRNSTTFKSHYPKNIVRPLNEVIQQLDQYKNLKFMRVVGSISEPTLYPYFEDFLKYLKSRNVFVEICTNGSTHDENFWYNIGTILDKDDRVFITICGSTQELHSRYRRGTDLQKIMKNAAALREAKPIDVAQIIRFNYNDDNLNSDEFKKFIDCFSIKYYTETFLMTPEKQLKENHPDFLPHKNKVDKYLKMDKLTKLSFNTVKTTNNCCRAWEGKWNQIDIYGRTYPCYLLMEYLAGKEWDGDWGKVLNGEYYCCRFCSKIAKQYCDDNDLDYII